MKLIKRLFLSMGVFIFLINGVKISCFAGNIENYEIEYNKITVRDGEYNIVFSDSEYYVIDKQEKFIESNEANYIHSIYESNGEVYLINIIHEYDECRWQLLKLNIGNDIGFEIIVDKANFIFNTTTNGVVVIKNIRDCIFEFDYYNKIREEKQLILPMDGFSDYGSLRNVKEIDIRESRVLFLTIGGEAIEYDLIDEKFDKIKDEFVYNLSEVNFERE